MKARSGFTLVEILIVVVILGILAAIVIPQFTEASTEAKTSALATDLQSVRSQIELYKIQHNDNLPGVVNGTHTAGGGGVTNFVAALTGTTDIFGEPNDLGEYGPYLQKIPMNQFVDSDVVGMSDLGANGAPGVDISGDQGWYFNTYNGRFWATDSLEHIAL
ncbi:MAG: type II secretion system protein [Planctomycetota bacterium]|jgi:general secretion pathway protein G